MPRMTKEQIDAEIVDRASAIFARHGFRHTSLQQIADEVGYSKAGLLHRFPNKEMIYRAAVAEALRRSTRLLSATSGIAPGLERDRLLIEALLDTAWELPGTAAFLGASVSSDPEPDPEMLEAGVALAEAFGIDFSAFDDERMARVIAATAGLQAAAESATRADRRREWRPHIMRAALDALGHHG